MDLVVGMVQAHGQPASEVGGAPGVEPLAQHG